MVHAGLDGIRTGFVERSLIAAAPPFRMVCCSDSQMFASINIFDMSVAHKARNGQCVDLLSMRHPLYFDFASREPFSPFVSFVVRIEERFGIPTGLLIAFDDIELSNVVEFKQKGFITMIFVL